MKAKPIFALLFFIAVVICYRIFGYSGHFGFDDMQYAEIATNMLNGIVDYDDHFTFRFTIIAATALSYKIFGINDFASSLPAMVLTILTLTTVYAVVRKRGFWATALALAITTTSQWILFYSNKLMPDIYLVFFTALAAYAYYRYRYKTQDHTIVHAILFSLSLFGGFVSKGTVVLLLPWLLYLFLNDCLQRKNIKFWKWAIISGAVWLIAYFASIKFLTGEFLYRFKAIAQNSYLNTCSYDQQPLWVLIKRLCFDFFDMTINSGMSVPMVCVVAAFVTKNWRGLLKMDNATSFFSASAALLFLSSNFMTISATSYVPMCIDPRHYLFFIPIAAIATALFINEKPTRVQINTIAILFLFLSVYSFFGNRDLCFFLYLPLTIIAIVAAILYKRQISGSYYAIAILLALLISPIQSMLASSYEYKERRDTLIDKVVNSPNDTLVVSDIVCTRMMRYYDSFSSNDKYVDFESYETAIGQPPESVSLVLNYHTLALQGMTYDDLPDFAHEIYSKLVPDFDDYGVKIYGLSGHNITVPHYDTIFCSTNTFEQEAPTLWRSGYETSTKTSYSGNMSNKMGTYSATFSFPIDSLRSAGCDTVYMVVSAQCNSYAKTDCAVVVSIEKADSTLNWSSSSIGNGIRAYSHWFHFDYQKEIILNEVPTEAVMNVYFFKNDKAEVYIDDFNICFCKRSH